MYSWINVLLEEAALSRKHQNINLTKVYFTGRHTFPNSIMSEYPNFENLVDYIAKMYVTVHQFTECEGCGDKYEELKPVNSFVYIYFSLKK